MSAGRSRPRQPPRLLLVPLLLTLLLCLLLGVTLSGAHLAGAAGLAPWFATSPLPALSPAQAAKLVVLARLAAIVGGFLLVLGHGARSTADRALVIGFAWLLLLGGALVAVLDITPALLGVAWPNLVRVEQLLKWAIFGCCALLLARRVLVTRHRQRSEGTPAGSAAGPD